MFITIFTKINHILLNPNVHYHFHKNLPLAYILMQINPVHAIPSDILRPILICLRTFT